ncbi:MAG TPA: deoxyribonuclease V [Gemmataceae bacterium]
MELHRLHRWDLGIEEAAELQRELAARVDVTSRVEHFDLLAGADVSYNRNSPTLYSSVVVLRLSDWSVVETQDTTATATFPYVPGFLSFRELPPLLRAFERLRTRPDVVICDGQGIAHPRRLGIASHLGLWLEVPTVGCGKSKLCGTYKEPAEHAGATSPLTHRGETIGAVLRTRARVKPVFVSPGHKITLEDAVRVVLAACRGLRLPETTRLAHNRVNELRARGGPAA